jgi:hypothetical protein
MNVNMNVTLFVGVPLPASGLTVAVKVTGCPKLEGDAGEGARVVVVAMRGMATSPVEPSVWALNHPLSLTLAVTEHEVPTGPCAEIVVFSLVPP